MQWLVSRTATGASINPARTFSPMLVQQIAGGTVKWEQLPVYVIAELLAGVLAGLAYVALTRGSDIAEDGPVKAESEPVADYASFPVASKQAQELQS